MATRPASAVVPQNGRVLGAGCWGTHKHPQPRPRYFGQRLGCCHAGLSVLLVCIPACQHANNWGCWHAGVHASSTDRPAFLPPSLAGWPSTSMPACQHANNWGAGMLGCMPAVQTHQNSWPPPGVLVDDHSNGGGRKCWSVCAAWVHPSMPAFRLWHAGMLACRSMASGQRGRGQECWDVCGVCMSHRTGNMTPI